MTPYSPKAIKTIKQALCDGVSVSEVRAHLGWDSGMFDRVCRKHSIDPNTPSNDAAILPVAKYTPPVVRKPEPRIPGQRLTVKISKDAFHWAESEAKKVGGKSSRVFADLIDRAIEDGAHYSCRSLHHKELKREVVVAVTIKPATFDAVSKEAFARTTESVTGLCASIIERCRPQPPHPPIFPRRQPPCESESLRQPDLCPLSRVSTGRESQ